MNKLFAKFSVAIASAFASFYAIACTEPNRDITGTAEERNQIAHGDHGNTVSNTPVNVDIDTTIEKLTPTGSSRETETSLPTTEIPKSSSSVEILVPDAGNLVELDSGAKTGMPNQGYGGGFGYAGAVDDKLLSSYIQLAGVSGISFDNAVYGINKTYQSCDVSSNTCPENETIEEYRSVGVHKVALDRVNELSKIFPKSTRTLSLNQIESLYEKGCALYVLNVYDTSPVWRVLSSISADSLVVQEISDNCDYERRPFDMNVGFLFSSCNELGDGTKIVRASIVKESGDCDNVIYEEFSKY